MIEVHAFLAAFAIQILAMSVIYPAWFVRYWRRRTTSIPADRLAQWYPDVDLQQAQTRFLTRYCLLNAVIAVFGLLLLGWLFIRLQSHWDEGSVSAVVTAYFMAQALSPLGLVIWQAIRFDRAHKRAPVEAKRTAVLQRRSLFDFVSPFVVFVAILSYFLFAALVLFIEQRPFPGFAGVINIVCITLVYAVNIAVMHAVLYGRNPHPFETHENRLRTMSRTVRSSVYSCIVVVAFLSLHLVLKALELPSWQPFALSLFFVITALLCSLGLTAPPRERNTGDGSGSATTGQFEKPVTR